MTPMFGNSWALALTALAAALVLWYAHSFKLDREARLEFADAARLSPLGLGPAGRRALLGPAFLVAAALAASVAVTRPLGPPDEDRMGGAGMDVIIALDVSDSMAVPDAEGARLVAAKAAVEKLVRAAPSNRYGLVLFSGEAVVSCPLTVDHEAFLTFLDGAGFSRSGLPGTAVGEAILTAATRYKESGLSRAIVVASDGENTYGADPFEAAKTARESGLKVYALGVGTKEGGPIPVGRNFFGEITYKRDRMGAVVNSSLDEGTLVKITSEGGGVYFYAGDAGSIGKLAGELHAKELGEVKGVPPDAKEYGPYLAFAAFALVAAAIIL